MKTPFDGDQLILLLMPDQFMRNATERLAPEHWVLSLDRPHQISGSLTLQGPMVDTMVNFVNKTKPTV